MATKGNLNKVNSWYAEEALETGKDKQALFSEYIRAHFNGTGQLSPDCDAKDLVAWVDVFYPQLFDEKGKRITE